MKIIHQIRLFILASGVLLGGCSSEKQASNSTKKSKPNIILIVSDDQGYADTSIAGILDDVSTPNLDRLASQGTRFTQAYATSPICNTSRCGIITGVYQQRFGMQWLRGTWHFNLGSTYHGRTVKRCRIR